MVSSKAAWTGALAWGLALALCLALPLPARAVDDTIGLFRPDTPTGNNTFFLRNTNTLAPPANTISGFGNTGDTAVVGDWDGDGITTIGVFRPNTPAGTNTFFLRNINTLGIGDITIAMIGQNGDIPVVGDWDGNGTTTVGLFRPNSPAGTNTFFLWNSNSNPPGPPDITIAGIGAVGDLPVVGDWDGNLTTTIGLMRPNTPGITNTFFLFNTNALGPPDVIVEGFGQNGDRPIAGDWDGDGTTTIGLFRENEPATTNTFFLLNTNTLTPPDIIVAGFGALGDRPVTGHWGNNPPVVDAATFSLPENSPNATVVGTVTFTDPDNPGQTQTFSIQSGNTGTAFAIDANTGQITVANSTALDFETNPSFSLTVRVTDNGTPVFFGEATITVNLTNASDAPVLTAGATIGWVEGNPAKVIDNTITVNDADSTDLTQATVQITGNFQSGADVLACPAPCGGLTPNFVGDTLTLSNAASLATYQAALRTVTYENTSINPTETGLTRTITWVGNDGTSSSAPVTSTINVVANNSNPQVTAGGTLNYTENDPPTAIDGTITVTDPDSQIVLGTVQITVNCTSAQDVLSFVDNFGVTSGGYVSGTCTLTLNGPASPANFQLALRSVRYSNTSDNPATAARTVGWTINDGGIDSTTPTSTINVTAVNDAPAVTAGAVIGFTEGDAAKVVDNGILITDADSTTLTQATAVISGNYQNGSDVLACPGGCNGLTPNFNAVNGTLTLNGTVAPLATYEAAMRLVTFHNTSDSPTATGATRTITWQVNDGAGANNLSNTPTSTINITGVNDPPELGAGAAISFTEGDAAKAVDGGVTVNDPDSATIQSATIQITGNCTSPEDVLGFVNNFGVTNGGYVGASCLLTLNGPASLANFQSALRSVTYFNGSQNPSGALRTVTWQANDGAAANNLSNTPTSTINVIPVNDPPDNVTDKSHDATGNVSITPGAGHLTAGATDVENNTPFTARHPVAGNAATTSVNGGNVTVNSDGSYSYNPPAGYEGADSFPFQVCDSLNACTGATVNLTVAGMIWFVNNNAASCTTRANGCGRLSHPYSSLADFAAENNGALATDLNPAINDRIFIFESGTAYSGPLTLLSGQRLIGQDASESLSTITGITPPADSASLPAMNSGNGTFVTITSAGNGVVLGQDNTLRGFTLGNATTALSGTSFGTLTLANGTTQAVDVTINTNGQALNLTTGTIASAFAGITSTGGTNNVALSSVGTTGTANLGGGALSGATGTGFLITGGGGSFTYSGTITNLGGGTRAVQVLSKTGGTVTLSGNINPSSGAAGRGIEVSSNTGGTIVNFSGAEKRISNTTAIGVQLSGNGASGGATINFTNGGLDITTTTATGFNASGGGTVNVTTGTNANTISTGTGTALNVNTTNIGASDLTFRSISKNGGTNGIVLNSTGSSGGLTVTGGGNTTDGGDSSGGTIQNTSGDGILLTSTRDVSLNNMNIHDTTGQGVKGTGVVNFAFTFGTVNNTGAVGVVDTSNLGFNTTAAGTENNLSGTVTITNNILTNAAFHGVDIFNFSGTIAEATISNNTITSTTSTATSKGSGIRLIAFGSASTVGHVTKATLDSNVISNFPSGAGIVAQGGNAGTGGAGTFGVPGNATNVIAITNNRIAGASPANRMSINAIQAVVNGTGQGNFNISNNGTVANPITNVTGNKIVVSAIGEVTVKATVNSNQIDANDTAGVGGAFGISAGADSVLPGCVAPAGANCDSPNFTLTADGNVISDTDASGIFIRSVNNLGSTHLFLNNNTVGAPLAGFREGIQVHAGSSTDSSDTSVCLKITNNTSAGSGGADGIGLRKNGTSSTVHAFAVDGMAATSSPGVETYVDGLNPGAADGIDGDALGVTLISAISGFTNCTFTP